jgi:hypothetical protein
MHLLITVHMCFDGRQMLRYVRSNEIKSMDNIISFQNISRLVLGPTRLLTHRVLVSHHGPFREKCTVQAFQNKCKEQKADNYLVATVHDT